jgi:signal transduction histidine kinase
LAQSPAHTILYIEDDPASRRLVERTLHYAGYQVLVAERGLQGIDMARQHQPDLILIDINLPDISGHEIATSLRSDPRFFKTPIVALTAQGYGEQREIAMAAGVTGYMTKPVDMDQLLDKLQFYLRGGRDTIDPDRLAAGQSQYLRDVVGRLEERIRQLEQANESLRRLDRMKETFIQITAHELRTPLTLVVGYSRLLTEDTSMRTLTNYDEEIRTLVQGLMESIERMHSVIEEIVTISRLMTRQIHLTLGATHLGAVAQKVAASYEPALKERRIELHFSPENWPATLWGDGELLRLALSNLVGNAIKYTPDGGHIYLTAEPLPEAVRIRVRDTGIGIDAAEQAVIFDRFHTVDDPMLHSTSKTAFGGGGLGLGLPICKGIVEAHGGTIRVESAGRDPHRLPGSQFIITLPLTAKPAPNAFVQPHQP